MQDMQGPNQTHTLVQRNCCEIAVCRDFCLKHPLHHGLVLLSVAFCISENNSHIEIILSYNGIWFSLGLLQITNIMHNTFRLTVFKFFRERQLFNSHDHL